VRARHVVPVLLRARPMRGPGSGSSRRGRIQGITTTKMWSSYCGVQRQGNGGIRSFGTFKVGYASIIIGLLYSLARNPVPMIARTKAEIAT
jgi:hypothetical protein